LFDCYFVYEEGEAFYGDDCWWIERVVG